MKQKWIFAGLLIGGALVARLFWIRKSEKPPGLADRILVEKSKRQLHLLRDEGILKTYRIALRGAPEGPKTQEGDLKTPEGVYSINGRNPENTFHLPLRISYPNAEDYV